MEYKPPMNISLRDRSKLTIFLGGTIDMDNSIDWQSDMSTFCNDLNFEIFNPRRDKWEDSWLQNYENPQFNQQVNWELNALEQSDIIVMYLLPNSKSPISLMELGLFARSGKLLVVCPDGFYRKGNVDIVCDKYNIPLFNNLNDLKSYLCQY